MKRKLPKSMTSHVFELDDISLVGGNADEVMRNLQQKLAAEGERLRRLLPDAPPGYHWQADVQASEDLTVFNTVKVRVVYRLRRG